MAIIGIDLGTTNTLAAVWKDNEVLLIPNAFGEFLTPSVVGISDDGEILTGKVAKERLISHPYLTAASFKRFMGTKKKITLGDKEFSPEELSSIILRKIKMDAEDYLKEPVTEAIISVPAYFNDNQRSATKTAGELAGIHVERLVNEPSAAALSGHFDRMEEEKSCLVIDFGGGTLDVSVVECFENVIEIVAVSGDNRLGGNDFDKCIIEYFCNENNIEWDALAPEQQAILAKQAELCKRELTDKKEVKMQIQKQSKQLTTTLTQQVLIQISKSLFDKINKTIQRALRDSRQTIDSIDNVILVGGSCKMSVVQEYLKYSLNREDLILEEPDTIVSKGVGIYTGMKRRNQSLKDIMMTDVCPFTLGTGVISRRKNEKCLLFPMIERNSTLPSSIEHQFRTVSNNQTEIHFDIYQGEEHFAKDNLKIGEMTIPVPPAMAGEESVTTRFTYDINGILEVEVYHKETNIRRKIVIVGEDNKMSPKEIKNKLHELEKLKIHPAEKEENQFVIAKGMRLYTQTLGELRYRIQGFLDEFIFALESQNLREIKRVKKIVEKRFDEIEEWLLDFEQIRDWDSFQQKLNEEDTEQ